MNRNSEQHFANVPSIDIQRSTFPLEQEHKTTFNVGDIIPFFTYSDILPGDTFKVQLSFVMRLQTPLNPTMDNLYADIYWFYDRHRNCWQHFREFMGENNASAWIQQTEYNVPVWQNSYTSGDNPTTGAKTLWDYMGLRCVENYNSATNKGYVPVSALPLRTYYRIYNRFFRDENLIAPVNEKTSDTPTTLGDPSMSPYNGKIMKASRFPDYFSKCLPGPQKSAPISIGIPAQQVPVIGNGKALGLTDGTDKIGMATGSTKDYGGIATAYNADVGTSTGTTFGGTSGKAIGVTTELGESGLIADLSNLVGATVNALRLSIQTQKIFELDARRGTRFPEIISAHFHTTAPDATIDYPEYLGGTRVPINITAVANTTGTTNAPQGYLGAFSHTIDSSYMFTKSFTEWGTLIGLVVVRAAHSYSQNINRMWTRQHRLDYYWPTLAHLGEQPVYNYELYYEPTSASNDESNNEVFGYQERWAEYRYLPNMITGEMRPDYAQSLDVWHYGDDYSSRPVLSKTWLEEPKGYVARTLAIKNQDQILADFNTLIIATRPMPVYSVPGLVDHF